MFYKDFLGLEAELPQPLPQSLKCGLLARPFSFGVGYSDVSASADLTRCADSGLTRVRPMNALVSR